MYCFYQGNTQSSNYFNRIPTNLVHHSTPHFQLIVEDLTVLIHHDPIIHISLLILVNLRLLPTPRRIRRPINRALHMPRNTILTRIKLASNQSILAKWPTNSLTNRTDCAVRVELFADSTC
jgi:hypothetical protein